MRPPLQSVLQLNDPLRLLLSEHRRCAEVRSGWRQQMLRRKRRSAPRVLRTWPWRSLL
jgi:hypothetical protein